MTAHCLLDSGSKGVLLSPEFMQVTGIKTFSLEMPIALQLACIGSHFTINYGKKVKIKFGHTLYDECFNVANIKYYDTVLGTPFLRNHNLVLDFSSPGNIHMGNKLIPMNKTAFDNKASKED